MSSIDESITKRQQVGTPSDPMKLKSKLAVEAGVVTLSGPNESNDDCLGVRVPDEPDLTTKGIAAVIADGVSVAEAGKQAAEICVQGFLNDYFDSPEAWTTKTAGLKVVTSLNRWLYSLGQGHTSTGQGYVTTFTGFVVKGTMLHLFHVGDTRLYRWRGGRLEQLTRDHSANFGNGGSGLARAVGMDTNVDVDYRDIPIEVGDLYLLSTDGIHNFLDDQGIAQELSGDLTDLNAACSRLAERALANKGNDNASAVLLRIDSAGSASNDDLYRTFKRLPFPPELAPGMILDGYEIEKELQATSRSQTYIAVDRDTRQRVVLKTPSVNFEDDTAYIERFIMEGWIGGKLMSERLAGAYKPTRKQNFLYTVLEYIEGQGLDAWIEANPKPDVREAVKIAIQVMKGLRVMHRQEMLHQDLKPSNVILHPTRGAVIIDYGSTHVPGIQEIPTPFEREQALGTLGYSAPEYFLNRKPTRQSDLFSLGVMLYEMLTGKMPYGEAYERCETQRDFSNLEYRPAHQINHLVPVWLDGALRKAVQLNPQLRYDSYSEFEYDLEHPNPKFAASDSRPWLERNPLRVWKVIAGVLFATQCATLWLLLKR